MPHGSPSFHGYVTRHGYVNAHGYVTIHGSTLTEDDIFGVALISGARMGIVGDSRNDNGMIAQSSAAPFPGLSTGVPEGTRLQGIHTWMLHALGWPVEIVGQWTQGGGKTSQFCHTHALNIIAARKPDVVMYLGTTNDPIDYSGTGGLGPIPPGDVNADPATLPRVGDRSPTSPGIIGTQGTTYGNLDKMLRFFNDPVANGTGKSIPVILYEIPSESPSRGPVNIVTHNWIRAQKAAGRYPNLIAPNVFTPFLTNPAVLDSPVRRDLKPDGTAGADGDGNVFIHPTPDEARFLGETMAADSQIVAAFSGRPSLLVLPNGSNNASFLNPNPAIAVGAGSGTLGYAGSATPLPTGTVADNWQLGHNVTTGTIGVVGSFDGNGDQVITITRTGGVSAGTPLSVELRSAPISITPVAGDIYVLEAEVEVPARTVADVFAVFPQIFFSETGLLDDYGLDIANGTYGSFASNSPNTFPNEGANLRIRSVPFQITPAMVASATGTIDISARCAIVFDDVMNTATNGALAVKIKSMGIRKLTAPFAHTVAPAAPAVGPSVTTAPSISGNLFVGSTLTIVDGAAATGSVTARRLLKNGSPVTLTGSSYTLVSGDLGASFVPEVTWTNGSGVSVAQGISQGPVTIIPATLSAAIAALAGVQNNGLYDFTNQNVSGTNWTSPDLTGNNNTATQTATVRHPTLDTTLGAVLDGTNDTMGYTWQTAAPTTATLIVRMRKNVGDSGKRVFSDSGTNVAVQYTSGAVTPLVGTWTVDGAAVTTQGQLYTALNDGLDHTVMGTGIDVSTWANIFFSRYSGAVAGSMRRGAIIDEATSNLASARAAVVAWLGDHP